MPKILIVGGTGMLGAPVVAALREAGHAVRVLARNPADAERKLGKGLEIVAGDVEDEASLLRALESCIGVHVNLAAGMNPAAIERIEHLGTARVAQAAANAGVRRLTYLSGGSTSDQPIWNKPKGRGMTSIAKSRAEYAIRESGVPYTIFRATMFMETLPILTRGGRAVIFGEKPVPFHWLAASDYASMVARAFENPAAANQTLYPKGPDGLTLLNALQTYRKLVLPTLKITILPAWLLDAVQTAAPFPSLSEMANMLKMLGSEPECGDPDMCNRLLGASSISLEAWCKHHGPDK